MKAPTAIGRTFGRLTITGLSHVDFHRFWVVKCRCTCGNDCTVRFATLQAGGSRSCGCLRRETARATAKARRSTTHGKSRTSKTRIPR